MLGHHRNERGPLSWQQEAGLVREAGYGRYGPVRRIFRIPTELGNGEFARRLRAVVDREDALHLNDLTLDEGGVATYRDGFELPLRQLSCPPDELPALATAPVDLPRGRAPRWEVTILESPDGTRFARCVFDHFVCDGYSLRLLEEELVGAGTARRGGAPGAYQEWVGWQREEFTRDSVRAGATRDFWLRHLDGTPADRPTPLPFALDSPAEPEHVTTMVRDLDVPFGDLRSAARRLRATPFLLILSTVLSTVAQATGAEDITVRVAGTGRRPANATTIGWFADAFPLRVRGAGLAEPGRVLDVAGPLLAEILTGPATAPWEYIRSLTSPAVGGDARRQIMINLAPDEGARLFAAPAGDRSWPGSVDALHLFASTNGEGRCRLMAFVDHSTFSVDGAASMLGSLGAGLTELTRAPPAGPPPTLSPR